MGRSQTTMRLNTLRMLRATLFFLFAVSSQLPATHAKGRGTYTRDSYQRYDRDIETCKEQSSCLRFDQICSTVLLGTTAATNCTVCLSWTPSAKCAKPASSKVSQFCSGDNYYQVGYLDSNGVNRSAITSKKEDVPAGKQLCQLVTISGFNVTKPVVFTVRDSSGSCVAKANVPEFYNVTNYNATAGASCNSPYTVTYTKGKPSHAGGSFDDKNKNPKQNGYKGQQVQQSKKDTDKGKGNDKYDEVLETYLGCSYNSKSNGKRNECVWTFAVTTPDVCSFTGNAQCRVGNSTNACVPSADGATYACTCGDGFISSTTTDEATGVETAICEPNDDSGCFSGDSLVHVRGAPAPVKMRDLRVGDEVLCVATQDFFAPLGAEWCEVMDWAHAEPGTKRHVRVHYITSSGTPSHITLSANHLVATLPPSVPVGKQAAGSVAGLLPLSQVVEAGTLQPGQRLVASITTSPANASSGTIFEVVSVLAVETMDADGFYIPAIKYNFIVVDGLVVPLWVSGREAPVMFPQGDTTGKINVLVHIGTAPIWTANSATHPVGTPGTAGAWGPGVFVWPGRDALLARLAQVYAAGNALNFEGFYGWFLARFVQFAASGAPITFDELAAAVEANIVPAAA